VPSLFRPDHEAFTCGRSLAFRVASIVAKYRTIYPSAIACMEQDWEACLTFYVFPKLHWKTICRAYRIKMC
jgi:transposase-like protein